MQPLMARFPLNVPSEGTSEVALVRSSPGPEKLKDYVRRKRLTHDPPLSLQDVQDRSARHGFKIDASYVSKIENGHKRNPGADALVALHYGLEAPLLELISVAAGKPIKQSDAEDEQLLSLFHQLADEDRDLAVKLLRTQVKARGLTAADVKSIKKSRRVA